MNISNSQKSILSADDKKLFISAMDEFNQTGTCSVKCNQCGSAIKFLKNGSAVIHSCECGKFSGTLRGL